MVEALHTLLAHGANVNAKDNSGETPLHLVRNLLRQGLHQRAAQVARALLHAGATVDAANNEVGHWPRVQSSSKVTHYIT